MTREQKIKALQRLLAGHPVDGLLPLIKVVLLPTKEVRPDLLPFVIDSTDPDVQREVQKRFCLKAVKLGGEASFEQALKAAYRKHRVEVGSGMRPEEYDAIREKFEKDY